MLFHTGEGGLHLLIHGKDLALNPTIDKELAISASAEEFIRQFPDGDISYQLKFALDYIHDGSIADWVLNLWPPGMPALYILILKLSGPGHFPLKIVTLSTLFYALASYLIYLSLARGRFSPTALVACAIPLACMTFQETIFLEFNLFSSDFYCFTLLGILLSLLFKEVGKSLWRPVAIAILLAALAYFRSFYFIFIKLLTFGSVSALAAWITCAVVNCGWRATITKVVQSKLLASVGMVLVSTWVLLLPWKAFLVLSERTFEWTATDQVWAAQWRNDLPPFFAGINTPCILEKEICEQLMPFQHADAWTTPKLGSDFYKRLSLATFISSPLKWYTEKVKIFHSFWFDGYKFKRSLPVSRLLQYVQSAGLLVLCIVLVLVSLGCLIRNLSHHRPITEGNGLYILFLAFFSYNFLVFTFVHYEPRYSIPLKWVTYLFFIFLLRDIMQKFDFRFLNNKVAGDLQ